MALNFGEKSTLEKLHCNILLNILSKKESNIIASINHKIIGEQPKQFFCSLILATDMFFHNSLIQNFNAIDLPTSKNEDKMVRQ